MKNTENSTQNITSNTTIKLTLEYDVPDEVWEKLPLSKKLELALFGSLTTREQNDLHHNF